MTTPENSPALKIDDSAQRPARKPWKAPHFTVARIEDTAIGVLTNADGGTALSALS